MRFTIRQDAAPDEIYTLGVFDGVGSTIPVNFPGRSVEGVIVDAQVLRGGRTLELTVEIPDDVDLALMRVRAAGRFSPA